MTKREAIVISAYTGVLLVDFSDLHGYIEEIMERPVLTHELANPAVSDYITELAKPEFIQICDSIND